MLSYLPKTKKNPPPLPIGLSDFKSLREAGFTYVDKTGLIKAVLTCPSETMLLPRPRRFGKTLNLSMLRYFFENTEEDQRGLFAETVIERDPLFDAHQGKYPVIFLSFKGNYSGAPLRNDNP